MATVTVHRAAGVCTFDFEYSPTLINAIRTVPLSFWDPAARLWCVPLSMVDKAEAALQKAGGNIVRRYGSLDDAATEGTFSVAYLANPKWFDTITREKRPRVLARDEQGHSWGITDLNDIYRDRVFIPVPVMKAYWGGGGSARPYPTPLDHAKDYYSILGVGRSAGVTEITKALRRMQMLYHPDMNSSPTANEDMMLLIKIGETLRDPNNRDMYDIGLDMQQEIGVLPGVEEVDERPEFPDFKIPRRASVITGLAYPFIAVLGGERREARYMVKIIDASPIVDNGRQLFSVWDFNLKAPRVWWEEQQHDRY